jgi:hypothetical protein
MVTICRPCITLRNGKRLCAHEVGKKAFCFEVDEERPKNEKISPTLRGKDEISAKVEGKQ